MYDLAVNRTISLSGHLSNIVVEHYEKIIEILHWCPFKG